MSELADKSQVFESDRQEELAKLTEEFHAPSTDTLH